VLVDRARVARSAISQLDPAARLLHDLPRTGPEMSGEPVIEARRRAPQPATAQIDLVAGAGDRGVKHRQGLAAGTVGTRLRDITGAVPDERGGEIVEWRDHEVAGLAVAARGAVRAQDLDQANLGLDVKGAGRALGRHDAALGG